jgi:hypothetical protein
LQLTRLRRGFCKGIYKGLQIGQRLPRVPTHSTSSFPSSHPYYIMSEPVGEAQWFQPTVRNRLSEAVVLVNFTILFGKFYDISECLQYFCFSRSFGKYHDFFPQIIHITKPRAPRGQRSKAKTNMNGVTVVDKTLPLALKAFSKCI